MILPPSMLSTGMLSRDSCQATQRVGFVPVPAGTQQVEISARIPVHFKFQPKMLNRFSAQAKRVPCPLATPQSSHKEAQVWPIDAGSYPYPFIILREKVIRTKTNCPPQPLQSLVVPQAVENSLLC